jgi:hypothetical protein
VALFIVDFTALSRSIWLNRPLLKMGFLLRQQRKTRSLSSPVYAETAGIRASSSMYWTIVAPKWFRWSKTARNPLQILGVWPAFQNAGSKF